MRTHRHETVSSSQFKGAQVQEKGRRGARSARSAQASAPPAPPWGWRLRPPLSSPPPPTLPPPAWASAATAQTNKGFHSACGGTAIFDAGGCEGRRRARLRKNCGHSSVLGRAGQLFTPLGRYAARDLAPATLNAHSMVAVRQSTFLFLVDSFRLEKSCARKYRGRNDCVWTREVAVVCGPAQHGPLGQSSSQDR